MSFIGINLRKNGTDFQEEEGRMQMKKPWSEYLLFGLILLVSSFSVYFLSLSPIDSFLCHHKRINCLLIGMDTVKKTKHADVILLLSYEPGTQFLDVLSIPRDLRVSRKNRKRLTDLFAVSLRKGDVKEASGILKKSLEEQVFKGNVDIPFYITINYNAFEDLIDLMGGVSVDIEKRMDYDDLSQDLHIHFAPGIQRLNGKRALEYIRFRHDALGDIGRIKRQQDFIRCFLSEIPSFRFLTLAAGFLRELRNDLHTNVNIWDFFSLLLELRDFDLRRVRFQTLPSIPKNIRGVDYLILDEEKAEDVLQTILTSHRMNRFTLPTFSEKKVQEKIVIEVFNATKQKGLAYQASRSLRLLGLDVVRWDNYGPYKPYTMVIDRKGNLDIANEVAGMISCNRVKTEIDHSRLVDVSIVLGEDFKWKKE